MPTDPVHREARWHAVAVLVWLLSRNCSLAGLYVTSVKPTFFNNQGVLPDDTTLALLFLAWWRSLATKTLIDQAVDNENHDIRIRADEFLMRSLVAEYIMRENVGGGTVTPAAIINKYCKLWSYRSVCDRVQRKLARLTWHLTHRKNFLRRIRSEWGFRPGRIGTGRALSAAQITDSVFSVASQLLESCRGSHVSVSQGGKWTQHLQVMRSFTTLNILPGADLLAMASVLDRRHFER